MKGNTVTREVRIICIVFSTFPLSATVCHDKLRTTLEAGTMSDNTSEEVKDMQARVVQGMAEFSASNPEIAEALAVMNMTMPDYIRALEAIRGGHIVTTSAYAQIPVQMNS